MELKEKMILGNPCGGGGDSEPDEKSFTWISTKICNLGASKDKEG